GHLPTSSSRDLLSCWERQGWCVRQRFITARSRSKFEVFDPDIATRLLPRAPIKHAALDHEPSGPTRLAASTTTCPPNGHAIPAHLHVNAGTRALRTRERGDQIAHRLSTCPTHGHLSPAH